MALIRIAPQNRELRPVLLCGIAARKVKRLCIERRRLVTKKPFKCCWMQARKLTRKTPTARHRSVGEAGTTVRFRSCESCSTEIFAFIPTMDAECRQTYWATPRNRGKQAGWIARGKV